MPLTVVQITAVMTTEAFEEGIELLGENTWSDATLQEVLETDLEDIFGSQISISVVAFENKLNGR